MQYTDLENLTARYLHQDHQIQMEEGRYCKDFRLSMWASPVYRLSEDGREGGMSCDTFTYRIFHKADGRDCCQVMIKRLECCFSQGDGQISMTNLRWSTIQEMKPWEYDAPFPYETLRDWPQLALSGKNDGKEVLAVRNLQNLVFEHRLHEIAPLFSAREQASLFIEHCTKETVYGQARIGEWAEEFLAGEKENHHCYLFFGITGLPVIEIYGDGKCAEGLFMTEVCRIDAASENKEEWKLYRHLGFVHSRFLKEEGQWRILTMELQTAADLPPVRYRNDLRYDKSGQSDEPWNIDQKKDGSVTLEDGMEAEKMINGWVLACRRGTLLSYMERYFKLPKGEPSMMIRSFGAKTKKLENLVQIREKLEDMTAQYRNRYYTFHAPTTPVLQYDGDKEHMTGTWFDCGTTNLRSAAKGPEDIPYMIFRNKYVHRFRKINGKWYFAEFYGEPVISMPDWHFDMKHSRGFVSVEGTECYPDAFIM